MLPFNTYSEYSVLVLNKGILHTTPYALKTHNSSSTMVHSYTSKDPRQLHGYAYSSLHHNHMLLLPIVSDNVFDRCGTLGKVTEKRDDCLELTCLSYRVILFNSLLLSTGTSRV